MIEASREEQNLRFGSEMTAHQFEALNRKITKGALIRDIAVLSLPEPLEDGYSESVLRKWLVNGWSTEYLLRLTRQELSGEHLQGALHWAFPQAYYAAYTIATGFIHVAGFSEVGHGAVLKRIGLLAAEGKYPHCLSCHATGPKSAIQVVHAEKQKGVSSISFDVADPKSIDNQLAQMLNATRLWQFEGARAKFYKNKKRLAQEDWEKLSEKVGPTTLLAFLYRKRIKANYQDIDTILALDAQKLHAILIRLVDCLNFTHELFIIKITGLEKYVQISKGAIQKYPFLQQRFEEQVRLLTPSETAA